MRMTHIHVNVADLPKALEWFKKVLELPNPEVIGDSHIFSIENTSIVLEPNATDSSLILAIKSEDCDRDYHKLVARGGVGLKEPKDYSTGSRAALIAGPGKITIELDQQIGT